MTPMATGVPQKLIQPELILQDKETGGFVDQIVLTVGTEKI